ncbi:MAG: hypothetical protein ACOCWG_04605, partial [bacterium]
GYKFGFNGQEKEDDIYGEGNAYSAEYWMYDSRLGRRWNVDPVDQISISNYATFANNPIANVDPDGDFVWFYPLAVVASEALVVTTASYLLLETASNLALTLNYEWVRPDGETFDCRTEKNVNEGSFLSNNQFNNNDPNFKMNYKLISGIVSVAIIVGKDFVHKKEELKESLPEIDERAFDMFEVIATMPKESQEVLKNYLDDNKDEITEEKVENVYNTIEKIYVYKTESDIDLTPEQVSGLLNKQETHNNQKEKSLEIIE